VKVKLDENIPASIIPKLRELGFDADTVVDESLGGSADELVWNAACAEGRLLVTQDLDFSDARRFLVGGHPGILLVRLPDHDQWRVGQFVIDCLASPDVATWSGCIVVATPNKVRVRGPG